MCSHLGRDFSWVRGIEVGISFSRMRQCLQLTNAFTKQITCAVILARSANQSTPPLGAGVQCLILNHGISMHTCMPHARHNWLLLLRSTIGAEVIMIKKLPPSPHRSSLDIPRSYKGPSTWRSDSHQSHVRQAACGWRFSVSTSTLHLKALHCSKGKCTEVVKSNMVTMGHVLRTTLAMSMLQMCVTCPWEPNISKPKQAHLVPSHGQ